VSHSDDSNLQEVLSCSVYMLPVVTTLQDIATCYGIDHLVHVLFGRYTTLHCSDMTLCRKIVSHIPITVMFRQVLSCSAYALAEARLTVSFVLT